jgi:hypothetical protein
MFTRVRRDSRCLAGNLVGEDTKNAAPRADKKDYFNKLNAVFRDARGVARGWANVKRWMPLQVIC